MLATRNVLWANLDATRSLVRHLYSVRIQPCPVTNEELVKQQSLTPRDSPREAQDVPFSAPLLAPLGKIKKQPAQLVGMRQPREVTEPNKRALIFANQCAEKVLGEPASNWLKHVQDTLQDLENLC